MIYEVAVIFYVRSSISGGLLGVNADEKEYSCTVLNGRVDMHGIGRQAIRLKRAR